MEHGVEYQAVLFCEDRMAAVGKGEKVPDEVIVAVTELGGVIDGVAEGRQPGYCTLLHSPGCSTPPTQHAQQYESVALPVQPAHVNRVVDVTVLVGVGVAPRLRVEDGVPDEVDVVDGVPGGVGERLAVAVPVEVRVAVGVDEGVAVEEAELMVVPLSVGVPVLVVSWLAWAAAKTASVTAARASARALDWWNICQAK